MFAELTGGALLSLAAVLALSGAATGLLAGLFGVGGGALIVPVLYELFAVAGVPPAVGMPLSVGTSLAIIVPTSVASYLAHRRRGAVDHAIVRVWALPVVLGVVLGSLAASVAPAELFKAVFVAVAATSAVRLLSGVGGGRPPRPLPGPAAMRLYGGLIGLLSALMGIGGGQLSSIFMTFYGRPIHQAIATSSALGVLIAVPGALGYVLAGWPVADAHPGIAALQPPLALGYVSLLGVALFAPTSWAVAPLGARIAHRLPKRVLELAFGSFLALVALRFAGSLAGLWR